MSNSHSQDVDDPDVDDPFDVPIPEDFIHFNSGDCACDHAAEDHGWGGCHVDGCECEACWEE